MQVFNELFNHVIGWGILHSLWQGAAIYIILFGIYLIFNRMSSNMKYKLAFTAQLSVFVLFIYTLYKHFQYNYTAAELAINNEKQLLLYIKHLSEKSWSIKQLFPYIATIYCIGIFVQLIVCLKSFRQLDAIKKSCSTVIPVEWKNKLQQLINTHQISTKVNLFVSEHISSPITFGFIKPIILIPTAYINQISMEEAESILLHELAHIKRFDYAFNLVLIGIETVLFFNPFVWLISRHIKMEREQSCDDFVINAIAKPNDYARTLLHVELLRSQYESKLAMQLSGRNNHNLLTRIKRINNQLMNTKYTTFRHQITALICVSITFLFVAWVNPKPQNDKKNDRTTITTNVESINQKIISTTDTTKSVKPVKNAAVKKVKIISLDTSYNKGDDISQEDIIKNSLNTVKANVDKFFQSKEWRDQMALLEQQNQELLEKYNSDEWKENLKNISQNAEQIEAYFNSPEWKNNVKKIENEAQELEKKFNSEEWKNKIAKIEMKAKELEEKFNSEEWKNKIAKVEMQAKEMEKMFNSDEWKNKIAQIELQAKKMQEHFNSPKAPSKPKEAKPLSIPTK